MAATDAPLTADLEGAIAHLSSFPRPSASEGEREAAEWIAARLRELGADARIEEEPAHGGYWWPVGLPAAASALAGLSGRRALAAAVGAAATLAVLDDITGGRQAFRRAALPTRTTFNVVAEAGDGDAGSALVIVAHHDAGHGGRVFDHSLADAVERRWPGFIGRFQTYPPIMWPTLGGPVLTALGAVLGSRRLRAAGVALGLGTAAAMADIAAAPVSPGANDNLTAVAALLALAERLRDEPVDGLRVLLVSTGSEESFMEGMQAFGRRHFPSLPKDRTSFIALEMLGSPRLIVAEGEGMAWMNDYPDAAKEFVARCAEDVGVPLVRGLRTRAASDGLIPLRAGYPSVLISSVDQRNIPSHWHCDCDTIENVSFSTLRQAIAVCEAVIRRLAQSSPRASSMASSAVLTSPA
jgi:Peptidase family M28